MGIRLILGNTEKQFDVTGLIQGEIVLEQTISGTAGKLEFSLIRDGLMGFTHGDRVSLFVDEVVRFVGFVMTKKRTSAQIIAVTAYDQFFYLIRNKDTMIYQNKKASELVGIIAREYGLETGTLQDTGFVIPMRIEEGQCLMDMILVALDLTREATGKEFFLLEEAGKISLYQRGERVTSYLLQASGEMTDYRYTSDISKDTYNMVRLYQAGRLENQKLMVEKSNASQIKNWGRLLYYKNVDHLVGKDVLTQMAGTILVENGRVQEQLVLETSNGGFYFLPGHTISVVIDDLAEGNFKKDCLIEGCTHIFSNGEHRCLLEIRMEG